MAASVQKRKIMVVEKMNTNMQVDLKQCGEEVGLLAMTVEKLDTHIATLKSKFGWGEHAQDADADLSLEAILVLPNFYKDRGSTGEPEGLKVAGTAALALSQSLLASFERLKEIVNGLTTDMQSSEEEASPAYLL